MSTDLQKQALDFSVSHKLRNIAESLEKLAGGEDLNESDLGNFKWGKELIAQIKSYEPHPELSVLATELKPRFYRLFGINQLGIVYNILTNYKQQNPSAEALIQISNGFQELSTQKLRELQPTSQI